MTITINNITFPDLETADAYWDAVDANEERAANKAKRLPKCLTCGQPLWLDQDRWNGTHHRTCKDQTKAT